MKITTLTFFIKDSQILLAMKKRGFGEGRWNCYGGKVQGEETVKSAAVREIFEESSLIVSEGDLAQAGIIDFYFEEDFVFQCHIFVAMDWVGDAQESEEMRPQWFPVNNLPFDEMWAVDQKWMPMVIFGKKLKALARYNKEGNLVKEFSYEEVIHF